MLEKTLENHDFETVCLFYQFYIRFEKYISVPACTNKDLTAYFKKIRNTKNLEEQGKLARQALDFYFTFIDFPHCLFELNKQLNELKEQYEKIR